MASDMMYLISLNKTPARAAGLVRQVLANLHKQNHIVHIANADSIDELSVVLASLTIAPGIFICSSQWSEEEQQTANALAKTGSPNIDLITIPPGLDARQGSDGIIRFLEDAIASALSSAAESVVQQL